MLSVGHRWLPSQLFHSKRPRGLSSLKDNKHKTKMFQSSRIETLRASHQLARFLHNQILGQRTVATYILLSTVILLSLLVELYRFESLQLQTSPPEFTRIDAIVTTYRNSEFLSTHRIEEHFSASQSRSSFKIRLVEKSSANDSGPSVKLSKLEAASIWIDTKLDLVLSFHDGSGQCRRLAGQELRESSYGQLMRLDLNLANSALAPLVWPEGPSRWLQFVSSNWRLFEKGSADLRMIRDTECYMYKLNEDTGLQILAFVNKQAPSTLGAPHPANLRRVTILAGDLYSIIDYTIMDTPQATSVTESDLQADLLLLDPLGGCLELLDGSRALYETRSLLGSASGSKIRSSSLQRFAFKASIALSRRAGQGASSYRTTVTYDEASRLMRIDLSSPLGDVKAWKQLVNFEKRTHVGCMQLHPNSGVKDYFNSSGAGTNCILTDIPGKHEDGSRIDSWSRLLTGSEQFAYLGLAKVRGLEAQVLASSQADMPYWLEPSQLIGHIDGSMFAWYPTGEKINSSGHANDKLVTVLYLSGKNKQRRPVLLALEQYLVDSGYKLIKEKLSVSFYDFEWSLSSQRIDSLLKLERGDLSEKRVLAHAQVHLLLDGGSRLTLEQLNELKQMSAPERDLSLLAALQVHLKAPASSISDLSSRLVLSRNQANVEANAKLVVSFNYEELAMSRLSLRRIGRGLRAHSQSRVSAVSSLAECALRAYQMPSESVPFGYDARRGYCVIERTDSSRRDKFESFKMLHDQGSNSSESVLQIFELSRTGRYDGASTNLQDWQTLSGLEFGANADPISDIRSKQLAISTGTSMTSFQLLRIHLSNVAEAPSGQTEARNGASSALIKSFALVPVAPVSERVERVPLYSTFLDPFGASSSASGEAAEVSDMSADLCRSTCSSDVNCGAYSLCLQSGELECVLTRASFDSIKQQLLTTRLDAKRSKLEVAGCCDDGRMSLELQVDRDANCAIYDKSYLRDFFDLKRVREQRLVDRVVLQAQDAEQCASWCASLSFRAIQGHLSKAADTLAGLVAERQALAEADDLQKSVRIDVHRSKQLANFNTLICGQLEFVSKVDLSGQPGELLESLTHSAIKDSQLYSLASTSNQSSSGFCLLPAATLKHHLKQRASGLESAGGVESEQTHSIVTLNGDAQFSFLEATFKVENYYEQQLGLSLKASKLSKRMERVFEQMQAGAFRLEASELASLIDFAKSGANQQVRLQLGARACARRCFFNSGGAAGPWPSCRSFDVVLEWDGARVDAEPRVWCQLNSVTLNQLISIEQLDLIDTSKTKTNAPEIVYDRRHFEPRPGLVLASSFLKADEKSSYTYRLIRSLTRVNWRSSSFWLLIVSLASLVAIGGFMLGSDLATCCLRTRLQRAKTRSESVHYLTDWHRRHSSNSFQSDAETLHSINFNSVINHS